jgi:hypothetical protein
LYYPSIEGKRGVHLLVKPFNPHNRPRQQLSVLACS